MPLNADPNALIPYVLLTDRALPEPRPTFMLRALTAVEHSEACRLHDAVADAATLEEIKDRLSAAIAVGLVELRNVLYRGSVVKVDRPAREYLTTDELSELARAVIDEPQLEEKKRRQSASSAASGTASTAASAAPAAA